MLWERLSLWILPSPLQILIQIGSNQADKKIGWGGKETSTTVHQISSSPPGKEMKTSSSAYQCHNDTPFTNNPPSNSKWTLLMSIKMVNEIKSGFWCSFRQASLSMLHLEKDPSHLLRVPGRLRQMPVRQVECGRLFPSTPPFLFCQVCSMEPSLFICLCMKLEWQCGAHQHSSSPVDRTTARWLQECISRDQEGNSICWDYYQRWNVPTADSLGKSGSNRPPPGPVGYANETCPCFFISYCSFSNLFLTLPNRNAKLMLQKPTENPRSKKTKKLNGNFYFFRLTHDFILIISN